MKDNIVAETVGTFIVLYVFMMLAAAGLGLIADWVSASWLS